MLGSKPQQILLSEYRPPVYTALNVHLDFQLDEKQCLVTSTVDYQRSEQSADTLELLGNSLELVEAYLNGTKIEPKTISPDRLLIEADHDSFQLKLVTRLKPQNNTALEGLYKSQGKFCTQCEPEGFRRITYFLDRPDVMAIYTTRIEADSKRYPVLLSNGNMIEQGQNGDRHYVVWHDPFPKPSYLFALVAGQLACHSDEFTTMEGRKVNLHIYVAPEDKDKCAFAMESLKESMIWDEKVYGLSYDLDIFNIVAVSDFNMGAMENKSLNIFNSKYVLADPLTATDRDYQGIKQVIAHEYFHNWTGNRVTCRDWFQLSLKEGLTVFRDQEFAKDHGSAAVVRIGEVAGLRGRQFAEDASPMAHPVRPDAYVEINNFYTATVYEKGAELIRMLYTLLGKEKYYKGIDLYFQRHDHQAVTVEHFVNALADASGIDLSLFSRWYHQAGTPSLEIDAQYDPEQKTYTLNCQQTIPDTRGQKNKEPHLIPIVTALLGSDGKKLPFTHEEASTHQAVLCISEKQQSLTLQNVQEKPVASLLRGFSAPVVLNFKTTADDLLIQWLGDDDGFNRYEAGIQLAISEVRGFLESDNSVPSEKYSMTYGKLLKQLPDDLELAAWLMGPPQLAYTFQQLKPALLQDVFAAREQMLKSLVGQWHNELSAIYERFHSTEAATSQEAMGARALKNTCLQLLVQWDPQAMAPVLFKQLQASKSMTDTLAALSMVCSSQLPEREGLLEEFYQKWQKHPLVVDKWFQIQASSFHPEVQKHVEKLAEHPDFNLLNPNRVYALLIAFCGYSPYGFHNKNGDGYRFLTDYILEIDSKNSQVAARIATALSRYPQVDQGRGDLMKSQLKRLEAKQGLSRDVFEIVQKSLNDS